MKKSLNFLSTIMLIVLCLSFSILAQETTGEIQGTIKDPQGAVAPNIGIMITGVDVGFNRTVTTNDEGFYRAQQIPPGIYTVETAATSGFNSQKKENIQVVLGTASTVDFNLTISGGTNVVDVTTGDVITLDTTETKVQTNITAQQLDTLPRGVSFASLLKTNPATRPEPMSGQFQIDGASGSENAFIIDGQPVENFRTGVLNQNNNLPTDIVQEVQIKTSGFEAQFGGATGGGVNLVTRGGNNEFHGRLGLQFEPSELQAGPRPALNRFTTTTGGAFQGIEYLRFARDRFTNVFPLAQVSGPIVQNRLWFLADYSPQIFSNNRTVNYVTPDPRTRALRLTEDYSTKVTNEYAFLRLDGDVSNKLRLTGTYTWNPIVQEGIIPQNNITGDAPPSNNFGGSIGTLTGRQLTERQGGRQNANNVTGQAVYTPNGSLVLSFRFSRGFLNEKLNSYFIPNTPRFLCRQSSAEGGCATSFQNVTNNNQIIKDASIRTNFEGDAGFSINLGGQHDFKFGYQNSKILNDVETGFINTGFIELYYGHPNPNTAPFVNFAPPVEIPASLLDPTAIGSGSIQRFGAFGKASNRNQAIYAQDKWQIMQRLTINAGVRFEKEDLPSYNGSAPPINFSFADKIAPRLGLAYDLTGDGKTKLFASYGQFYDRLKFELPRGSFGGNFFRVDFFQILPGAANYTNYMIPRIIGNYNDAPGGQCPITRDSGYLTLCQVDFRIASNASGASIFTGLVDPDLKPFRQDEITVGFQRDLFKNYLFSFRYTNKRVINAIEDAGFPTPDGSEAYIIGNPGSGLHLETSKQFGYVKTTSPKRRYDGLEFSLDRRFANNFYFNVNYTFSRLYGNYSGLASSDEINAAGTGRTSPGVNRFFDLPFVGFTATGEEDLGRLATDRPHTFNAFGGYTFDWFGSKVNETTLSGFTSIWSGTPMTTFFRFYGIPIPLYGRGDLGRTEKFT